MQSKLVIAILLMSIVTYLPRFLPMLFLSNKKLPPLVESWLSYVPVAVLSALLGPILFIKNGQFTLTLSSNPYFWAALPTFIIALLTRNMFLAVLTGMGCIALLRMFVS